MFDLAAVEVVEWPASYSSSMFHSFADQSASFLPFSTLSSFVQAESDEGNHNGEGSDDGSPGKSLPSLKSESFGSELGSEADDDLCTPCDGKSATLPRTGTCFCCARSQVSSIVPKATAVIDIQRPSRLSNPFFMKNETERDRVCDAFAAWWEEGSSTVALVAVIYHVRVARQWKGDEIARSDERMRTVRGMASIIANGGNVSLACACFQGKRCHGFTIRLHIHVLAATERMEVREHTGAEADMPTRPPSLALSIVANGQTQIA